MIARAEMSTNPQSAEPQSSGASKGMAVALIGPNDAHRQVVAKALASAQGRKIHEFIDYPATLNDLARMMETKFDVVLVDVDTDESYALQIISKLSELGPAVMAYSARTDEDLLKSCMRAGARDFLPLPSEDGSQGTATPVPQQPASVPQPVGRQAVAVQPAAKPVSAPVPVAPRSNVTPIVPERRVEAVAPPKPARVPEATSIPDILKDSEKVRAAAEQEVSNTAEDKDFAAWDAANLRRASMPPVPKPEARPRPALVPEKRKAPEPARVVPEVEEKAVVEEIAPTPIQPPIERPPVAVDIFRSSMFQTEPSEAAERQGANWLKWVLIGAGPIVLALVLLIVFTRSSSPTAAAGAKPATADSTPAATTTSEEGNNASDRLIVNATGKTGPNPQPVASKPTPAQVQAPQQDASSPAQPSAPISPDAMAAQLVAPTRIAGQIKKASPADEPPPSAPSPVSLDDNNSVSGSVFGNGAKAKFVPHVVPLSAGVAAGMLIHKTAPVYPKFAQDAHITGTVVLKATITKQGSIEGIQVLSGPKLLASSAVDAVKMWKYKPYMLDGQPVAVETNVTVVFGGKQ